MRLNQQKQKRKNIVKKMTATIYVIAATETYIFSKTKIAETKIAETEIADLQIADLQIADTTIAET